MSVSLRRHPNSSGLPLTDAQLATVKRWEKRHPKLRAKCGGRGRHSGFASILVDGLSDEHAPTIDSEGYVVAWAGHSKGWVRLDHPINPQAPQEAAPDD